MLVDRHLAIDLLHKNFIHYKFVSYGKSEACHTRQVNVASGVISVKLEMFVCLVGDVMLLCCAWFVLQYIYTYIHTYTHTHTHIHTYIHTYIYIYIYIYTYIYNT